MRIVMRKYLARPETKSLGPDGKQCSGDSKGLLRRSTVFAKNIVVTGKEADRRWEAGEDMSLIDFEVKTYGRSQNMVVAHDSDRARWSKVPVRELMRRSGLSEKAVYAILGGKPVRLQTLSKLRNGTKSQCHTTSQAWEELRKKQE